jgi:hypothetical protein
MCDDHSAIGVAFAIFFSYARTSWHCVATVIERWRNVVMEAIMQQHHGLLYSFPQYQAASPYRAASSFQPFASALDDVLGHDNWQEILSKAFEDVSTDGADFAEAVDALPGVRSEGVRLDWPEVA